MHGVQYMHISNRDQCNWLRERIETKEPPTFSKKEKIHILDRLAWSEMCVSTSACLLAPLPVLSGPVLWLV